MEPVRATEGVVDELRLAVDGMTCEHCARAVRTAVSAVPGVREVDVELSTGALRVSGTAPSVVAVRAAVVEAGYAVRR